MTFTALEVEEEYLRMESDAGTCPRCGGDGGDNWFDRSLCPCEDGPDWGVMHTRCRNCGFALDGCEFETLGETGRETKAGPPVQAEQSVASLAQRSTRAGETVSRRAHNPETPGSTPGRAMGAGQITGSSGRKLEDGRAGNERRLPAPDSLSPSRRALGQALLEWGRKL